MFSANQTGRKNCIINFLEAHAHACNLSSLGLSNICAQGGYCLSVAFEGNARFFFVCESMPSKGVENVESNSWPIDDRDWDWMLVPSHARQRANQRDRNVLCHVE